MDKPEDPQEQEQDVTDVAAYGSQMAYSSNYQIDANQHQQQQLHATEYAQQQQQHHATGVAADGSQMVYSSNYHTCATPHYLAYQQAQLFHHQQQQLHAAGLAADGSQMAYSSNYHTGASPHHLAYQERKLQHHQPKHQHHQQQQLQTFWASQMQEIEQTYDFKNPSFPLARIKRIMRADEDVRMISATALILFSKACEMFTTDLTLRSWAHTLENKRKMLQRNDIAAAIARKDAFDFLADIFERDELKEEGHGITKDTLGHGITKDTLPILGSPADPRYYHGPPQYPVGPIGMIMGNPIVDQATEMIMRNPVVDQATGMMTGNPVVDQATRTIMRNQVVDQATGMNMGNPVFDEATGMNMENPVFDQATGMNIGNPVFDEATGMNMGNPVFDQATGMNMGNPIFDQATGMIMGNPIVDQTTLYSTPQHGLPMPFMPWLDAQPPQQQLQHQEETDP